MSESSSSPKASPSLLSTLRKFRFHRTPKVNGNAENESTQESEKAAPVKTTSEVTESSPVVPCKRRIAARVLDSDSDESEEMSMADLRKEIAKNFENVTAGLKSLKSSTNTSDSETEGFNKTDTNLKILAKEFPDMDEMELLDVLARNSMDMKRALNVLRDNNYKDHKEKPKPLPKIEEEGNESNKQDLNGTIQRQWKRIRRDKITPKKKVKKVKRVDSDDDEDDANPYAEQKVYESEDSDEENVVDVATLTSDKCAVLEFFSTATFLELAAIPNCSRKKAEVIISLRPFESWTALVKKLQNAKSLGPDLLNASHSVLRLRQTVNRLMQQCKNLSEKMEEIVRSVQSGEIKTASIKEQPRLIPSHLKLAGYQMIGLNWLVLMHKQRLSGILADEMGLGKTIQIIALLAYLKEQEMDGSNSSDEEEEEKQECDFDDDAKTHLIVCPSSTLENWINELNRWCPSLRVKKYFGSQEERQMIRYQWIQEGFKDVDVIVTTYHMVGGSAEGKIFRKLPLDYVVFDEAHMLKNMATQRYENLIKIKGNHRVLLTGTPLQNNLVELMSLLVFVMPNMFAGKKDCLKQLFSMYPRPTTSNNSSNQSNPREESEFESEQLRRAKEIMRPFFLRRLKKDVLQDLPKKTDKLIYIDLPERQKELYQSIIGKYSNNVDEIVNHIGDEEEDVGESKKKRPRKSEKEVPAKDAQPNGLSIMMMLRKVANHPLLIRVLYDENKIREMAAILQKDPSYQEENLNYVIEDLEILSDYELHRLCLGFKSILRYKLEKNKLLCSGKFEKFDEIFPTLKKEGHRVLIFSQFIMMLDLIGDYLAYNGYRFLRLDGTTPVTERQTMIDEYNRDEDIFAFMLSTKAGGMGINLTSADTVVIHDMDFNPYNDKQAEDRCHRVGQQRDVTIMRFICKDTIEEGIYTIAQEKLNLEKEITTGSAGSVKDSKNIACLLKQIMSPDSKTSQAT